MPMCTKCKKTLSFSDRFCSGCGTPAASGASSSAVKSAPAAPKVSPSANRFASSNAMSSGVGSTSSFSGPVKSSSTTSRFNGPTTAAASQQSTFGGANVSLRNDGVVKCGLPTTTYEKQPAWATAERHKNQAGQWKDGTYSTKR